MHATDSASTTAGAAPGTPVVELPDEDRFVLPQTLVDRVHPRRGGRVEPSVVLDPDAANQLREQINAVRAGVDEIVAHPDTDEVVAAAARGYLDHVDSTSTAVDGVPPLGAAAVLLAAVRATRSTHRDALRSFVDAWIVEHGVVFAARAVVDLATLSTGSGKHMYRWTSIEHLGLSEFARVGLARMRAVLAVVGDADYRAAVDALADRRTRTQLHQLAVSFLVPTCVDWVTESCAVPSQVDRHALELLVCSVSSLDQLDVIVSHLDPWWVSEFLPRALLECREALPTITDAIGSDITFVISWLGWKAFRSTVQKPVLALLKATPTDAAFELLLDRSWHGEVRQAQLDALTRFPMRGLRLLAARVAARSAGADDAVERAAELLRGHVLRHPDLVAAVLPTLPDELRATVESVRAAVATAPEAPAALLPPVLVSPPWTAKAGAAKKAVRAGLVAPSEASVRWRPGEQQEWADRAPQHYLNRPAQWGDRDWTALAKSYTAGALSWPDPFFLQAPEEIVRPLLSSWELEDGWDAGAVARALAGRYELDALPVILRIARANPREHAQLLMPFASAEIATLMADWYDRLKTVREVALAWFERHPRAAALGLIPAALGKPGKRRTAAERVLHAVASTAPETVRDVARGYGPEVVDAVDALLNADPLHALPARLPAPPSWLEVVLLPQILLRDRAHALPATSVEHLCTMLALSRPGEVYAGVPIVKDVCDPRSLAEFGWALLDAWYSGGMPVKDSWVLDAQGWLGDDDTAARLLSWKGLISHARTLRALDALAAIGTETALRTLHAVAERRDTIAEVRERAQQRITQVAAGLGLTVEQLADRLVPDLGLDADGSLLLDYGPRRFVVGFDEQLNPYVTDENGQPRKSLPKPGARDDAELAPAAHARFTELKKAARKLVKEQLRRFEHAMIAERRWSVADFRTLLVAHPLLRHLVRRLVWIRYDGDGQPGRAFRVAEDRTFADVEDTTVHLGDDDLVGIAHPLHLGAELTAWAEVFADYEILQPFAQLDRETHQLTAEERTATSLTRFEGRTVRTTRVLGLEHRGWQKEDAEFQRPWSWIERELPGGHTVVLNLDPGVLLGELARTPEQRLVSVHLAGGGTFGSLSPVVAAEVLRDLVHLTAWSN
ncbi:DUF4132 domain-containing protein [Goodfellowiella coeruleoviolacea]|uniref:DUF4132 domain-containing protein n=1 Tax=Goodfellowiella coeruleoviolacea TaxID=334858 RepID=A0AAE3G9H2_9PSEU|nr:DUF4132 domain-containing protein [Goodfellowiella coeruleoviolacea]MCP2164020.1 protein of unknown function (DUF4132) [Goodfellowiella coeruleoviolacea]